MKLPVRWHVDEGYRCSCCGARLYLEGSARKLRQAYADAGVGFAPRGSKDFLLHIDREDCLEWWKWGKPRELKGALHHCFGTYVLAAQEGR